MASHWTEEQRQVIAHRGENLLVSAAAGSGKTAVLVARIIALITGEGPGISGAEPLDIDRILVLTFTNAAAGEMRDRIRDALEQRLDAEPDNEHLQRQVTLVHRASITTIDSFCSDVIRNHFNQIDLEPGFRVAEEGEITLLAADELGRMMEEEYARMEDPDTPQQEKEVFADFIETFSGRRSDQGAMDAIRAFYNFSMASPWPRQWREDCLEDYRAQTVEELEQSRWMPDLLEMAGRKIDECIAVLEEACAVCRESDGPWKYGEIIELDLFRLRGIRRGRSYEAYADALADMNSGWERLPAYGKKEEKPDPEKQDRVKRAREQVKKIIRDLQSTYFSGTLEDQLRLFQMAAGTAQELVRLTNLYEERFTAAKRKIGVIDFADMEHMALNVLVEKDGDQLKRTPAAMEYAQQFAEVMTDEYQDSNLVQEIILDSISGGTGEAQIRPRIEGAHNRFMVGDVKQSIYKFRQASPEIFMKKYHDYISREPDDAADESGENVPQTADVPQIPDANSRGNHAADTGRKIGLSRNFRSRRQVLASVNGIFRQIMHEDLGGVEYDDAAALYPGADYPESTAGAEEGSEAEEEYMSELWLLDGADPDEAGMAQTGGRDLRARREAALCARRIQALVGRPVIWEGDHYRPAGYGDVAILLRSMRGWSETYTDVFAQMGIPSYAGTSTGYFSAVEVQTVISLLSVIDNPLQDIPLAGAMRSPIGNFTDDELARIRAGRREKMLSETEMQPDDRNMEPADPGDGTLCESAEAYARSGKDPVLRDKVRHFLAMLEEFREYSVYTPIHELIFMLLERTGYGDYVQAMPAGDQRKANLDRLIEQAVAFEKGSYRGVFHFLRYIENLRKFDVDYGEAPVSSDGGDAVRIMSVHKSKGLEFPIVFVCGLGRRFNLRDTSAPLLMHPDLGLGVTCLDRKSRRKAPVLLRSVLADRIRGENLGEELRVLYVAMTRAREKLILVGSPDDLGQCMDRWRMAAAGEGTYLSYSARSGAGSMLDWVMEALIRDPALTGSGQSADAVWKVFTAGALAENPLLADLTVDHDPQRVISQIEAAGNGRPGGTAPFSENRADTGAGARFATDPDVVYDRQLEDILRPVFEHAPARAERLIPARVSVSELKHPDYEAESEDISASMEWTGPVDDGVSPDKSREKAQHAPSEAAARRERMKEAADRGTSFHLIMEKLDYHAFSGCEPGQVPGALLELELERLIKCGKIHEDDLRRVRRYRKDVLMDFIASPLGARFIAAAEKGQLHRESPFVLGEDACRVREAWHSTDMVMIQGIIDAWLVEDGQITLVDYKTDTVPDDGASLVRKYKVQLALYKEALERLTGLKVREVLIWSTSLGRVVPAQA